jgi:hypothetical protein
MKPNCELCGLDLPADGVAFICSYECTYCVSCADEGRRRCPNCRGEVVRRPRRAPPRPS